MGRRPQPHHLGPQLNRPVVLVVGDVVQGGVDGHAGDTSKSGACPVGTRRCWPVEDRQMPNNEMAPAGRTMPALAGLLLGTALQLQQPALWSWAVYVAL